MKFIHKLKWLYFVTVFGIGPSSFAMSDDGNQAPATPDDAESENRYFNTTQIETDFLENMDNYSKYKIEAIADWSAARSGAQDI